MKMTASKSQIRLRSDKSLVVVLEGLLGDICVLGFPVLFQRSQLGRLTQSILGILLN